MADQDKIGPSEEQSMEVAEEAREQEWRFPSFAGQLFIGQFNPQMLHPFPQQSAEDRREGDAYLEKITRLMTEMVDPEEVDASRELPKEFIAELGKLGAFAIKVPKQFDGLGLSQVNYGRIVTKTSSYCGGTSVLLSAHQSIGVPQPLRLYGTEEQKRRFFPRFRKGEISAFALTEPEVGSDPARMSAEAKLSADGTHYILNGDKLWCTNGTVASIIVVLAKTAPKMVRGKERPQISAFIVEMNSPGVEIVHRCEFMGIGGIYNGLLRFTNVKVPLENRLGEEGRGLAIALATVNVGRLTLPAASLGVAKQCLRTCRQWGRFRVQWGQPVGLHEAGRQKIAYIAATTFAMEAISWLTSHWADEGKVDIRIEAAMSKLFCTEALWKIVDMTLQLRGGRGYEKARSLKARGEIPYPIERAMRDCRINLILEGSSEIMKLFLAREAMDPHFKKLGFLLAGKLSVGQLLTQVPKVAGHYLWWYTKLLFAPFKTRSYSDMGPLARYFRFIEKTAPRLARNIFYYMMRYRKELEHKQMLLGRLIEIGTDLFVMAATCSYAISESKAQQGSQSPIHMAEYFCQIAMRRIQERFAQLTDNDDFVTNQIAGRVMDKEYVWMEEGIIPVATDEEAESKF